MITKKTPRLCLFVDSVNEWTTKDVVQWLGTINLGAKLAEYVTSITDTETTGEDLIACLDSGKDKFVIEMKENYGFSALFSRRMFKSLLALRSKKGTKP